jgi:hypothetical protein
VTQGRTPVTPAESPGWPSVCTVSRHNKPDSALKAAAVASETGTS